MANKTASFRWPVIAGTSQGKGPGADPGRSDRNEPKLNVLIPFTGYIHRFLIDFNDWNFYWSLCFGLLSFLIIVGNALSISILFKRRLRKRPHFLLISLAFADLLVGLIPVPLLIMMADSSIIARFVCGLELDLHPGGYFPWKTPRHCSPSSPSTTHLTQLRDCHSNAMDLILYCDVSSHFSLYNLYSDQFCDNY